MSESESDFSLQMMSNNIFKLLSSSGILKIISQLLYFAAREILLYNLLDDASIHDFTIFNGLVELIAAFMIITPYLLPKLYQEFNKKDIHKVTKKTLLHL